MKKILLSMFLVGLAWCSLAQKQLINPVLNHTFPDPTVIRANGKYYAYGTNGPYKGKMLNIQLAVSADLQNWQIVGDALPQKPAWANSAFWAPHVLFDNALQQYVMFYSGQSTDADMGKCIGVAFSKTPEGPFIDKGTPLITGKGFVNIDPMAIIDPISKKKLLYWGSGFEPLKVQELSDDWKSFKIGSVPKILVQPKQESNYDKLIEGSWIDIYDGKYYLYYSGDNCCGAKANYAVMVARADNAFGPFTRLGEVNGTGSSVVLAKSKNWLAPGHNSIVKDDKGNRYMVYHAIRITAEDAPPTDFTRVMLVSPLKYIKGWPVVQQP